ncbi:MAG: hypothetical protein H3Z52_15425 [archaeon]|nr:hypothetical protein [archaeon]
MDEEILREKVNRHLEELLDKLDEKKRIWMKDAIGMVTSSKEAEIFIKSGIITDIGDWEEVYTRQTIDETIKEFQDKKNWQKWTTIAPALIADLERSENIAKEVAKKHGVNLQMVVDRTRAHFVAEIDGWNLECDELLRQTYKHVDAMFEAWGLFLAWLHGKERLKIVRNTPP